MKQIEVTIMGQSYILGCPEGGESSLLEAVGNVDREMSAIRDGGRVKARERIAVLAALNLAYALAERPAAPKSPPASVAVSPSASSAPSSSADDIDIDALIHRVDQALGADGQLL
ncbi:cell division protein ZapA [Rhizobacter sp. SG703]|uniref:cell division protein ZapA n=1 Tax=Rhizobacter sp. SG703 TaxID=2587140 RepID=UPI0014450A0D|nr:cell division protein ZapA [Rhizobacter sp. SG703]NKI97409.1 cell division protein ZapA [Rhizobacter sp. SG703]